MIGRAKQHCGFNFSLITIMVVVAVFSAAANAKPKLPTLQPIYSGNDIDRTRIAITLVPVASGLTQPTDIQFMPGQKDTMVVLEKTGTAKIIKLEANKIATDFQVLFTVDVNQNSEMGLLGLAFHPDYLTNKTFVIDYNPKTDANAQFTRISKWQVTEPKSANEQILLEVPQPFTNHKAGQLAFGPNKYLFIGFGDGGSGGDPNGNAQNMQVFLGKMLRINIDKPANNKPYSIPADNPFFKQKDALPEIWALGLRNPWRYSFDNQQRLIVADVGQDKWEEIDIVEKGFNMGWNKKEASACYPPDSKCATTGTIDPIYEYGRDDGSSVTGGYVYNGNDPKLKGKYIFGDFMSGHIWALELPVQYIPNKSKATAISLGHFKINPSTFGRDAEGNVYVADFNTGIIYRLM